MLQRALTAYRHRRRERQVLSVTLEAARRRAGRGAAYLDAADPGWHGRLDPATLELSEGSHCVLGQLHGGFRRGLLRARILDLSSAPLASLSPVDLGFQARRDLGDETEALDYSFLTHAWREALALRRGEAEGAVQPALPRPAAA